MSECTTANGEPRPARHDGSASALGRARRGDAARVLRWPIRIVRVMAGLALLAAAVAERAGAEADAAGSGVRHDVLVVTGAAGSPEFGPGFARAAERWRDACTAAGASCRIVGLDAGDDVSGSSTHDRDAITAWFGSLDPASARPAWFVYVGHGTWDGRESRLNLRGADLTGSEFKLLVDRLGDRPTVVIHGGSASGPWIPLLAAPHRVIVTATASGDEVNYARLGEHLAEMIGTTAGEGDLDMDGQVSLLEAFIAAARRVELFYSGEGRLATEHALLEDNGDGRGTPPEFFSGARLVRRAADGSEPDGALARRIILVETATERSLSDAQRARRDALEDELEQLRARKPSMPEADYMHALEELLRRLAAIYTTSSPDAPPAEPPRIEAGNRDRRPSLGTDQAHADGF